MGWRKTINNNLRKSGMILKIVGIFRAFGKGKPFFGFSEFPEKFPEEGIEFFRIFKVREMSGTADDM